MSVVRGYRLLEEEADALDRMSDERSTTVNGLVRIAIRALVGLPNPAWAENIIHGDTTPTIPSRERRAS